MPSLTLYYPSRRRVPRKLAVLIEFLRDHRGTAPTVEPRRPGRRASRK